MKLNKWTVALAAAGLVSLGQNAQAEEAGNAVMTAFSKTTLSGFVDTSLSFSEKSHNNGTLHGRVPYQGKDKMNGINLDVIQLSLASPLDESDWAAGYAVDLLFGPDAGFYSGNSSVLSNPSTGNNDVAIRQAYVNTRVPVGNGLDLKMGVFDAIIGYEGFSNRDNPNYSRNMAYNLQPFNHTGLLGGYQINDLVSAQFGVANTGSNVLTARADDSSDIAYMGSVAVEAPENFGALAGATVYVGYMELGGGGDERQNLYVGSTIPTPIDGLALGAAWDNVQNIGSADGVDANIFAGYISYQATDKMSVNGRIEYLDGDADVLFSAVGRNGAIDSEMLSLTGTVQYDLWDNVLTRAEVRWDSLEDGDFADGADDDILTFTLNAIYSF
jgi:hypothetical protein